MSMRAKTLPIIVVFVVASFGRAQDAADRLHAIFEERFAWRSGEFPEQAMARGDYSHAGKITDNSLVAIERRHRETPKFLNRLSAINRSALNKEDQLNYDLFERALREELDGHRFRMFLAPITGRSGPQQTIPQMAERVRFNSFDDYANYLKRLEQVPGSVLNTIDLMRLGLKEGRTPPRVTLLSMPAQFKSLLDGGLDALSTPFHAMPKLLSHQQRAGLKQRFDEVSLPAVRRAIGNFGDFVVHEYIPNCRETIAAHDLPDGEAYYAYQLGRFTTTDMTAGEIHELGLREVGRIKTEMMQVIRSSDFVEKFPPALELDDRKLFKAFIHYLRSDPRFYHKSGDELLKGYRDICKRVDAWLPKMFKTLPRLPYGVREIPTFMAPSQTTAYYNRGDIRNAQPGYFYANTYALDQRPKYEMTALAIHEAVPGHHLQIALAQELENVPEFRKEVWFTAFGEGWALYSEHLGIERGMYEDPYDNFGRLLYEMWRACRLVVDPGMHALSWSREEAVAFMLQNTALSELNINNEIDRYLAWPGQATAYKIGELKIRQLRERGESTLGHLFDIREFHDVVLGAGSIPLTVLERRVDDWIDAQSRAASR